MRKNQQLYNARKMEAYHSNHVSTRRVEKTVAVTPAAKEMELLAIELEKAGRYRRASALWLKCLDMAQTDVERAKIAIRRQQCITHGNKTNMPEYSGIMPRGVVYD